MTVPAAKQTAQANGEEPTKVCRRMMITGTLQPKRICSTPEEWAAFDKGAKEGSDRLDQMRRSGANTGIGGRPQR